ncbi:similar to Saccharomyces cerevisiae YOR052C Nuclear protein of unknown function [Maudiozyma barnettii]|uniref:AN1-type domain-containing protein n=1 Tax=Maudiozyma barnettii TaxID=61262 RepID=A0A8H2VIZ5_9SACH|nr:Tmc1p [Kazachstania barnettii]CAB4256281.1 similar to Saccharomyces cerevisiae YOR052C Nuclear protein of unknown function [Kazachstania barnettii]CAD1784890.1 similar to Saccharomyces cerevisiae YOR052C Nuclear protein of unknown function [Kazachstania barnettii]
MSEKMQEENVTQQQSTPKENTTTTTSTSSAKRIIKKSSNKKKRKNVCYMDNCSNAALKFIGDCNFCHGHYCSKHRIMENHKCTGLDSCKEQMHKRNADKLDREQTIIPKIQI